MNCGAFTMRLKSSLIFFTSGAGVFAGATFKAGYVINDRMGSRVLRDPYTAKPYVLFYTTKRVGGGVLDPNAIRLLKISA